MIDWPYPHYHEDMLPKSLPSTFVPGSGYGIYRSMKVGQLGVGQDAELQLRSYRDSYIEAEYGPIQAGGTFEHLMPHLALWLRAHDMTTDAVSNGEEVFDLPAMKMGGGAHNDPNAIACFRGDNLGPDASEWDNLDALFTLLEVHMGLAANNPRNKFASAIQFFR